MKHHVILTQAVNAVSRNAAINAARRHLLTPLGRAQVVHTEATEPVAIKIKLPKRPPPFGI